MKFRKKPVVIEATKVANVINLAKEAWINVPAWLRAAYDDGKVVFLPDAILINTLEGQMRASLEDWIIQGVQGELYPCKPDIFVATYDPV